MTATAPLRCDKPGCGITHWHAKGLRDAFVSALTTPADVYNRPETAHQGFGVRQSASGLVPLQYALPEPPSANRWWRRSGTHMHLSKAARDYKANVALLASMYNTMVLKGPVRVTLDWYRGRKSGDLDKRIGVVLDALQGVFYENDAQIVELLARRFEDKAAPRVVVRVWSVP